MDAAVAVAGPWTAEPVGDLFALVSKSMVATVGPGTGPARYELLETLCEFGAAQLDEPLVSTPDGPTPTSTWRSCTRPAQALWLASNRVVRRPRTRVPQPAGRLCVPGGRARLASPSCSRPSR